MTVLCGVSSLRFDSCVLWAHSFRGADVLPLLKLLSPCSRCSGNVVCLIPCFRAHLRSVLGLSYGVGCSCCRLRQQSDRSSLRGLCLFRGASSSSSFDGPMRGVPGPLPTRSPFTKM